MCGLLALACVTRKQSKLNHVVDYATVHRWAIKILPVLAAVFRRRKRPVGVSWRMDESDIKVAGQWKYLYRAVDRDSHTIDFLLRAKRDCAAARCFLERAIDLHGVPEKIGIDKSGANTAAIEGIRAACGADIGMRQIKYLNNIVEQDHRAIKRVVRPMLGFKTFRCARGSKPEPQKFPSSQLQPGHERVQVNHLAAALEGVVPVQQDVAPGCR